MSKFKNILTILICALTSLTGCTSLPPHQAYEQDKPPENRSHYQGMAGYKQFLKDETYLGNKEQYANCQRYLLSLVNEETNQQLPTENLNGYKSACKGSLLETVNELERKRDNDKS